MCAVSARVNSWLLLPVSLDKTTLYPLIIKLLKLAQFKPVSPLKAWHTKFRHSRHRHFDTVTTYTPRFTFRTHVSHTLLHFSLLTMFHFVGFSLNPSNDVYRNSGLGAPYNRMDELQSSVLPYCIPTPKGSDICSHHSPLHKLHRQHRLQPVCFPCACVTWSRPSAAVPFRTVQFLHFRHKPNRFKFRAICFSLLFTNQFISFSSLLTSHNRHAAAIVHDFWTRFSGKEFKHYVWMNEVRSSATKHSPFLQ